MPARPRARARPGLQVRLVLLLRRAAARPGAQQHEAVPPGEPRPGGRDRGEAVRRARRRAEARAAAGGSGPGGRGARGSGGRLGSQGRVAKGRRVSEKAFERALEALALRARTTAELAAWLAKRGFERAEIEDAVDRLVASGAVDDERFATEFAADKRELRGWGPDRIREA